MPKVSIFPCSPQNRQSMFHSKSGQDPSTTSAFRPTTLLSTIGKPPECTIREDLIEFMADKGILHSNQFGFRSGYSCQMAVNHVISTFKRYKKSTSKREKNYRTRIIE